MPAITLTLKDISLLLSTDNFLDRYSILHKDGASPLTDGEQMKAVGRGGFGVVFRAKDKLGIPRAVKFVINHSPDSGGPDTDLFAQEVRLSNARPFKNVIPVMDYGSEIDSRGQHFQYFVSPFLDGPSLEQFFAMIAEARDSIRDDSTLLALLHDQVMQIIQDILAGLVELRDAGVVHLDLSPGNILLRPPSPQSTLSRILTQTTNGQVAASLDGPNYDAFIIDLGAAKAVSITTPERTVLRTKQFWFPESLLDHLDYRQEDHKISRARLADVWQRIDVYSCGRIIERALLSAYRRPIEHFTYRSDSKDTESNKEQFWQHVFGDDLKVIEGIIDQMIAPFPAPCLSAIEAKRAFETIPLSSSRDILASEVLTDRHSGLHIRTAPRLIRVNPPFEEIVEHPVFQRLRRKSQLGVLDEVYPDATHTRFSHSLQVFALCKTYILSLMRQSKFRVLFQRMDVDRLLAAALVHDLGQYPFAHSIEDLRKKGDLAGDKVLSQVEHDQERLKDALAESPVGMPSIGSMLENAGISGDDLIYLTSKIAKKPDCRPVDNIGRDLISGMLDVDRVAYLTHDSERAGVSFGGAIDVESLVEALTIRCDPEMGIECVGLGLEERGVPAAEAVLTSVYWMYRNVYWRKTNRAFMSAIKYVFERLLRTGEMNAREYWNETLYMSDWEAMLLLQDRFLKIRHEDEIDPLDWLASFRRIGFRRVLSLQLGRKDDIELYRGLVRLHLDPGEGEATLFKAIRDCLPARAEPLDGEILLDVPLKRRLRGAAAELEAIHETKAERGAAASVIWVCRREHLTKQFADWVDLNEYSPLVGALGELEDRTARKIRLFMHADLLDRIGSLGVDRLEQTVRGAMLDVIREG